MNTKKSYSEYVAITVIIILAAVALFIIYNKVEPQKHQDLLAEIFKILFGSVIVGFIVIVMKYLFDASVSKREKDKITSQQIIHDKYELIKKRREIYEEIDMYFKEAIRMTSDPERFEIPGFLKNNAFNYLIKKMDTLELIEPDSMIDNLRNKLNSIHQILVRKKILIRNLVKKLIKTVLNGVNIFLRNTGIVLRKFNSIILRIIKLISELEHIAEAELV
jgi:hypothetical protein